MDKRWLLIAMGFLLCSPTLATAQATDATGFLTAAEQGNAEAQFKLGEAYYDGRGVAQDRQQALRWFRAAAEQGHAEAQYSLGFMYQMGRGVPADRSQAQAWYQKAAAQGHAEARSSLKNFQTAVPAKKSPAVASQPEGFGGKESTPEQMQERKKLLASIPDSETIVFQPTGKAYSVYTIFVDYKCGHCARLFTDTAQITASGIKVRYVMAFDNDISRRIWCSADRGAALKAAFQAGDGAKSLLPQCASSFATRFEKTSQSLGISATPTTFTDSGRVLVGYDSVASMLFTIDDAYLILIEELRKLD